MPQPSSRCVAPRREACGRRPVAWWEPSARSSEAPARASLAGLPNGAGRSRGRRPNVAAGTRIATGLAVPLEAAGSPERLERALLDHLADRASGDSYLAALLDRPISRPLTRLLLRTRLAPSHVTLLGVVIGLLGALGLATVSYWGRLLGALFLVASLVLDCVDGDMARARLAQDPAGARLDLIGDYLVNLAVFGALAVGLLREGLPPGGAWAALALVTGVGAAMAVGARPLDSTRPPAGRRPSLGRGRLEPSRQAGSVGRREAREPRLHIPPPRARGRGPPRVVPLRGRRGRMGVRRDRRRVRCAGLARTPRGSRLPVTAFRRRRVELACIVLGSAVLVGTVAAIGVDSLARDLRLIGWGLAAILLVESLSVFLNTGGWALAFPRGERMVSMRSAAGGSPRRRRGQLPHALGHGRGRAAPGSAPGPEVVPASLRWASVSVAKVGQSVAQAVFIFLGLAVVLPRLLGVSPWTGWPGLVATVVGGAAAVVAGAAFVWMVGRGFWATARGALGRVRLIEAPAAVVDRGRARTSTRRSRDSGVAHRRIAGLLRPGVGGRRGRDLPHPATG